jgi:hypothetical protein
VKYLHLLFAALFRKKTRTVLTLLSVTAAFALFGLLDTVRVAFSAPETISGIDRLIVASRFSIIQPLPYAQLARIESVPGVKRVTYANWFGGIYQDPKNFFANIAVEPRSYLELYPELVMPASERDAFLKTRTGAIVGASLAERFGWKVGDKIPLKATIFPHPDGSNLWTFDLAGIYRAGEDALRGIAEPAKAAKAVATTPTARSDLLRSMHVVQGIPGYCRREALWFSHSCPNKVANTDQLRLEASPTRRAMTMAGNRTPRVDKKVASILAEVLTA